MSTPQEVIALAASEGAEFVDVRFTDVPGVQHHFSMPIHELTESVFEEGLGFDGSSVRGFQTIDASRHAPRPRSRHRLLRPVHAAQDHRAFVRCEGSRDRRDVRQRPPRRGAPFAGLYGQHRHRRCRLLRSGGRVLHFRQRGLPEPARCGRLPDPLGRGHLRERASLRGRRPQPRSPSPLQGGYFPLPPVDTFQDLRSDMVVALESVGIPSRCSTTRWAPPARPRSTWCSTRCCPWPTRSSSTNTW